MFIYGNVNFMCRR